MKNAHLRFGWLNYVKSTEKTTTSIRLRLDRFIGEVLPDPPRQAKAHLISVIGGDTQIAAVSAAISLGDRFMVEGPGVQAIRVGLERNAQCFKGSVQLAGRKKPLRHLIALSEEFASSNISAGSGRTLLASSENRFIWASIAQIHGIPGMPEWADWFAGEMETHRALIPVLGIGCDSGTDQRRERTISRLAQLGCREWSDSNSRLHRFDPLAGLQSRRPLPAGEVTHGLWFLYAVTGYKPTYRYLSRPHRRG